MHRFGSAVRVALSGIARRRQGGPLSLMELCSPLSVLVDTDNVLYVLVGGTEVSTSTPRPPVPHGKKCLLEVYVARLF